MLFDLAHRLNTIAVQFLARGLRLLVEFFGSCLCMLRSRVAFALILRAAIVHILCVLVTLPIACAQDAKVAEYQAKANFPAVFPNFIDWPEKASSSDKGPLLLCVFGDFSFGTSLAEATRASSIHRRRLEVRWVHLEMKLSACRILFISSWASRQYGKVFKAIQGASELTVGETPDFLASGGAVDFLIDHDRYSSR